MEQELVQYIMLKQRKGKKTRNDSVVSFAVSVTQCVTLNINIFLTCFLTTLY